MIEIISLGLLTIFSIYYVYFITRVRIGLLSLRSAPTRTFLPTATVIVAARNEEKILGKCLQSLANQTYPPDKYEIIIIDDGSTDNTGSIVKSFSEHHTNIHLLSFTDGDKRETGRKPLALAEGIARATGEIILTTDADCIVPQGWIEAMAKHFQEDVVFVAGPVVEKGSHSFFARLEQLEFLGLISTAAGLIASGKPIICNGANLAYRKTAYTAVGGFGNIGSSNDDELLMNKIVRRKVGNVVFAPEASAVVTTDSSNTLRSFLRQRIRWANKRGHYEDKSILFTLVSLYFFFLSLAVIAALVPQNPQLILPLGLSFSGKVMVDFFTLRSGARLFKERISLFHFLIAELLHVPYIIIAAAIGQVGSILWKGRKIRR